MSDLFRNKPGNAAVAFPGTRSEGKNGADTFRVGVLSPLVPHDPRGSFNFANMSILWQLFEPPYRSLVPSGDVEPVLLDYPLRAEPSQNGSPVYSAAVMPDRRFWDGTVVTAEHIADSLRKTASFSVQATAVAQGNRVFFVLKRPNAHFKFALARHDHPIILEQGGDFLGTGPYMIGSNPNPERFRLVRNPHYGTRPGPAEIECKVYPVDTDGQRRKLIEAVNRGDVDFTEELSREQLNSVERMRKMIDQGFCTAILFFNTQRPLFRDSQVRRAVASAIDRKALAAQSYSNALAFAATGLLPPSLGSAPDGIVLNVKHARELLVQAGMKPEGVKISLWTVPLPRPHLPNPRATAELIAKQLGGLGFQVEVAQAASIAEYYEMTVRSDYDLLLSGWVPDTSDPLDMMESLFASYSIPEANEATRGANFSRWSSAEMDAALRNHRTRPDPTGWQQICQLLSQEVPALPLMYGPRVAVVSWRVKKFPRHFAYRPFLSDVEL